MKYFLLSTFVIFLLSCNSQEVVDKIQADTGQIDLSVDIEGVDFGYILPETTHTKEITIENNGGFELSKIKSSSLNDTLRYKGGVYPGTGGSCGEVLSPGDSCTIVIEVNSTTSVEIDNILRISYHDGVYPQSIKIPIKASIGTPGSILYGKGIHNSLEDLLENLSNPVTYDTTAIGLKRAQLITLGNNGDRVIKFKNTEFTSDYFKFTGGTFPGLNGTCKDKLKGQKVCLIEVSFEPIPVQTYTEYLNLEYHNGVIVDNGLIGLAGESINNFADLRFNFPTGLDFEDIPQGKTVKKLITVINDSIVDATDVAHNLSTNTGEIYFAPSYPGTNGTCGNVIPAGSSCYIEVTFNALTLGAQLEVLDLSFYNNNIFSPETKTISLNMSANVKTPANLSFDTSLSTPNTNANLFPDQATGSTLTHTLMIVNTGGYEATHISTGDIIDATNTLKVITGGTCGSTKRKLIPSEGCTIRVKATSNTATTYNKSLTIDYSNGLSEDSSNSTLTLPVSASFVEESLLSYVGGSNKNFGDVLNGATSNNLTITLQNIKTGSATGLNFDLSQVASSDFNLVSNTCGSSLAGSSTCSLTFNILPSYLGTHYINIPLSYSDLLGTKNLTLNLSATARNPANVKLADIDGTDITTASFGDAPTGISVKKTFMLKNTGGLNATNLSVSIGGSDFAITNEGTCGGGLSNITLANGENCSFEITFNASSASLISENFDVSFYDGGTTVNKNLSIEGTGTNSGYLEVSGADFYTEMNLGNTTVSTPRSNNLTFTNIGSADVSALVFDSFASQFSIGTNSCTGTIPSGTSCTVELIFTPDSPATYDQRIDFNYFSSLSTKSSYFRVTGRGLTYPDLNIIFSGPNQPNGYDFGDVPLLLKEYLTININNIGQTSADNLSIIIDQGSLISYSIVSTNCPTNLAGSSGCQMVIEYEPEDKSIHNASLQINYTGFGNEVLPQVVSLEGEGVSPLSDFKSWKTIYSTSDNTDNSGVIKIEWEAMTSQAPGIVIDGYKLYQNIDDILPTTVNSLTSYEVATINGDGVSDRVYELSNLESNKVYYFTVRPTYLGQIMETEDSVSMIKVIVPPKNMALVHPFIVNRDFCKMMNLEQVASEGLGCAYTGIGNSDSYFKAKDYLFVDRYEISENLSGDLVNVANNYPKEFINQFSASSACKEFSIDFQEETRQKRLLKRSEWVQAAAWPELYSYALINSIENDSSANDCKLNQTSPSKGGASSNCKSRYGIYDMPGNLWEWNSDQLNGTIGWNSSIDSNSDLFGANLGGGLFPDLITNMPCFNYSHGIAQAFTPEVCPNGVSASSITNIIDDFYFPPVGTGLKSVRSGGSIGLASNFTSRRGGRFVGDFNVNISNVTSYTGARCAFSISE